MDISLLYYEDIKIRKEEKMEKIIRENHVIDDMEIVGNRLEQLVPEGIEISKMYEFIHSEKSVFFYFDQYLNEKQINDAQQVYIVWIDSGYCYNNEPIFISLVNYYGEFCGHFVGTAKYLINGLVNNNGHSIEYSKNMNKFKNKYQKRIEQRTVKHLCTKGQQKSENGQLDTELARLLNQQGYHISDNVGVEENNTVLQKDNSQKEISSITKEEGVKFSVSETTSCS